MVKKIVNLENLKHNLDVIRKNTSVDNLIVDVKANAYGHGVLKISKFLYGCGINTLAVSSIEEAKEILALNLKQDVLVLGYTKKDDLISLNDKRLIQTIISIKHYEEIKDIDVRKQVNVNTGMNCLGLNFYDIELYNIIKDPKVEGIHTNLYCHINTNISEDQLEKFNYINYKKKKYTTITKQGLLEKHKISSLIVGLSVYGYEELALSKDLKPVMSLYGKIINVSNVKKGEAIGYNGDFITNKDLVVGTVLIGYGNGIPFNYKNGYVYYNNKFVRIIGQVTTNYMMIDLTNTTYNVYDYVEVFGSNYSLNDVANKSNTVVQEILVKSKSVKEIEYI